MNTNNSQSRPIDIQGTVESKRSGDGRNQFFWTIFCAWCTSICIRSILLYCKLPKFAQTSANFAANFAACKVRCKVQIGCCKVRCKVQISKNRKFPNVLILQKILFFDGIVCKPCLGAWKCDSGQFENFQFLEI